MLNARGGLGGNVALQSSDVIPVMGSGIGGNGGVVDFSLGGISNWTGSLSARGGLGGSPAPSAGSNGLFGTLTTSGSGLIRVPDAQTLDVGGNWSNQLAVSLTGTGKLSTSGQLTNTAAGTIELAGTASTPVVTSALVNAGKIRKTLAGTQSMALSQNTGSVSILDG